jgi:hypothetical protein
MVLPSAGREIVVAMVLGLAGGAAWMTVIQKEKSIRDQFYADRFKNAK